MNLAWLGYSSFVLETFCFVLGKMGNTLRLSLLVLHANDDTGIIYMFSMLVHAVKCSSKMMIGYM